MTNHPKSHMYLAARNVFAYRFAVERAVQYPRSMVEEGFENDDWQLTSSFNEFGAALRDACYQQHDWAGRAHHRVRNLETGDIMMCDSTGVKTDDGR
jgi:hypothetical protein